MAAPPSNIELILGVPPQSAPVDALSADINADPVPIITKDAASSRGGAGVLLGIRVAPEPQIQTARAQQLRRLGRTNEYSCQSKGEDGGKGENPHAGRWKALVQPDTKLEQGARTIL